MFLYVIGVIFAIFGVALILWIGNVIYVAFVKKKDDREKLVVIKAMAHSFVVILVLNVISFVLSFFECFTLFMQRLGESIEVHPIILYLLVLGVLIYCHKKSNKRKEVKNGMDY